MTAPVITPLPPAPTRADAPSDFTAKADAFVAAQVGMVAEFNASAEFVDQRAIDADASAQAAANSAGSASSASTKASQWADAAENVEVEPGKFSALHQAIKAAGSATAAQGYADNLATLDALWLGAAASDPATGKDGAALVSGNAYVNTVTGYLRAYNGTAWVQGVSEVAGVSSLNGQTGDVTGIATQDGAETLTNKILVDPIVALSGSQGAAGQVPISQGAGLAPVWGSLNTSPQIMIVQQQGASGSNGGSASPGVWVKRLLNTVVQNSIPGALLAANSITLPAGTYVVQAVAQAGVVALNKIKIYNETDSADLVIGHSANSGTGEFKSIPSPLSGAFTLAGTKQISLRHRASTQSSDTDFGFPSGYGVAEVFAHIHLERI